MAERKVHLELPKPVIAFAGLDDEQLAAMEPLAGSAVTTEQLTWGLPRPWDEVDVAVVEGAPEGLVPVEIPLIYTPSKETGVVDRTNRLRIDQTVLMVQRSTDAIIVEWEPKESEQLTREIEAMVRAFPKGGRREFQLHAGKWTDVFVTNRRNEILAGEYRKNGGALSWILPYHVSITASWL